MDLLLVPVNSSCQSFEPFSSIGWLRCGEDAGDIPDWVQGSPYLIDDAQRLLNI